MAREGVLRAGSRPVLFAVVFVAYAVGSGLAFALLEVSGIGAILFVPAGVLVGALVLAWPRRWTVLAAGALAEAVMDLRFGDDYAMLEIVGYVLANTLGPLVAAALMVGSPGSRRLDLARRAGLFRFAGGAAVGALVSSTVGSGAALGLGYGRTWSVVVQWWLGDLLGVVLVGGLILARAASPDRRPLYSLETMAYLVAATVIAVPLYWSSDLPLNFAVLLPAMALAVRCGSRAVTTVLAAVALLALTSVAGGDPLLVGSSDATGLMVFKIQYLVFALTGLYVAAESFERELAVRTAMAEHERVELLQRALLPACHLAGRAFSAEGVYLAASDHLSVGGDWYDVVELPDGAVVVCVGDVVGHGLGAVEAMGRLRFAIAAIAGSGDSPSVMLDRLDEVAHSIDGALYSTVWVGRYDPGEGELTYSSAGHPPALIDQPGDQVRWLDQGTSVPLGMRTPQPRPLGRLDLHGPATLLVYTDGIVERRGEQLDVGLTRLATAADRLGTEAVEELLAEVRDPSGRDDSVLLRVELWPKSVPGPNGEPTSHHGQRRL